MCACEARVLIADDNLSVRIALFRLLGKLPEMEVVAAVESGEKACQVAAVDPPDIVLMDMQMPGMGGEEATRWLTSHLAGVRVIGISAAEESLAAPRMQAAGAFDFVSKTEGMSRLVAAVRAAARTDDSET